VQLGLCRPASTIAVGGALYALPREDMTLLQVLRHHSFPMDFECMQGSCKKCLVEVELGSERAGVLACQEPALDGMRVLLEAVPDPVAARQREQEAREKAQREALARRTRGASGAGDAEKPRRAVDRREGLPEVVAVRELLASGLAPAQLLAELRELLAGLSGSRFWDVEQACKLDAWVKKQSWGRDKRKAEDLRRFISARLSETEAEEVESMAC